jgi:4-amino-4-deoxy-L-arabinose transferase-like glycosyltransferase
VTLRDVRRQTALRIAWWLVVLMAIGLRVALFSGYGLGDDPNYYAAYRNIDLRGHFDPDIAYDLRLTFAYPVVWSMQLFGVTEWAFVGFVTACSVANVLVVYGLARQDWDRGTALVAMTLMAVLPLEVTTATLFVIDVPLATYCYAALWLYRLALRTDAGAPVRRDASAVLAGLFLFAGYIAKQWAVLVGVIFACEYFLRPHRSRRAAALCAGTLVTAIAIHAGWQWRRFGDPLHDFHTVRSVAYFEPLKWAVVTDYARMLMLPSEYRTWFMGWYPHALFALALAFLHRVRAAGKWLLFFLVELAALSAMPSHRENGHWVQLVPHIFRYLCFLSIPLVLALTAYVRELLLVAGRIGVVAVGIALVIFVQQAIDLSRPTRDAFGEQRRVSAYLLATFPRANIASDYGFYGRMENFDLDGRPRRFIQIRGETPEVRRGEFMGLSDAIVVTGGARLPWYGCVRCAANISGTSPPPSWQMMAFLPAPVTPYRIEPFVVWRVPPRAQ